VEEKQIALIGSVEVTKKDLLKDYMWNRLLEDKKEVIHKGILNGELKPLNTNGVHHLDYRQESKAQLLTPNKQAIELEMSINEMKQKYLKSINSVEIEIKNYSKKKHYKIDWLTDINNSSINLKSKILNIIDKGKQIEEEADMKLKVMRAGGLEGDLDLGEHSVDMLLNSIKTKLSVLKQL
jgi:hypothetical protein